MNGGKEPTNNRGLVVVLVFLCLAIVGLAIGIVAVNLSKNNEQGEEVVIEEEEEEITPERASYNDYVANFKMVKERTEELLKQDSVSASALIDLYQPYIEQCLTEKQLDRASAYIRAENQALIAAGHEEQALDELLKIDYSVFNEPEQYKYYTDIIELATKLGKNDVVTKYEPLAVQTKEAYDKNNAASDRAAAEGEAVRQRAKQREQSE